MAVISLAWSLLLLSSLYCPHAQTPATITLGSSITAGTNSSWRSLSGDFAFGFYPLTNGLFHVGIWFDKIPERTLVWLANRDEPAEYGSTFKLIFNGRLELQFLNGSLQQLISTYSGASATLGFMQNNGNFVLRDSGSRIVWQSFDFPTDTILPSQRLVGGLKLFSNARSNPVDYSTGRFMFEMQNDGNLVLSAYHFADPGYWVSDTMQQNVSLVFNQSTGLVYLVNSTHVIRLLTTSISAPIEDYYHKATLDDNGNLQQYVYHKRNGSQWMRVWKAITEPCLVNAICGVYGFCTSPDNETVTCSCLPGYSPLDPSNPSKGCFAKVMPNYCAEKMNFTVEVIDDANFPSMNFADMASITPTDVESCKKALMDDCSCIAASLVGHTCNKKKFPLLNSRKSSPSTVGIKALIKVPIVKQSPGNRDDVGKKKSNSRVALKAGFLTSVILALLFAASAIYFHPVAQRFRQRKRASNATTMEVNFREFTFKELREATNGFNITLGRGSSGTIYSGILRFEDKQINIAVKRLEKVIERGEQEFLTEVRVIGRTYHKNLVRLLGYCYEDNHCLSVYELMKNGTLSSFLFRAEEKPRWYQRAEMALGIARGLLYLHEECETQIIHCDIKPQNVLLGDNHTAKIADFGLAKLLIKDQTRTSTNLRGTMGYIAPEWLKNVPVATKVDVYSFGVVLLEIICCRRHIELNRIEEETEDEDLILTNWVLSCMISGKLERVVMHDPEVLSDFKRFERMAMVGLWCVHPDPILRPSMKKVTQMLEGTQEVGIPPLVYHQNT